MLVICLGSMLHVFLAKMGNPNEVHIYTRYCKFLRASAYKLAVSYSSKKSWLCWERKYNALPTPPMLDLGYASG